jgi:hypothetical protein
VVNPDFVPSYNGGKVNPIAGFTTSVPPQRTGTQQAHIHPDFLPLSLHPFPVL